MENKNSKPPAPPASSLRIFSDPKRSRILWHDNKAFAAASSLYLENMLTGVYGKLPRKLKEPLGELHAAAVEQLIALENNSILNKIEVSSLTVEPNSISAQVVLESVLSFLAPLLKKHNVKAKTDLKKEDVLLDQRYGSTLLQNMILLALKCLSPKGQELSITFDSQGIRAEALTECSASDLETLFSQNAIYSEQSRESNSMAVAFVVNAALSRLSEKQFTYALQDQKILFQYA